MHIHMGIYLGESGGEEGTRVLLSTKHYTKFFLLNHFYKLRLEDTIHVCTYSGFKQFGKGYISP